MTGPLFVVGLVQAVLVLAGPSGEGPRPSGGPPGEPPVRAEDHQEGSSGDLPGLPDHLPEGWYARIETSRGAFVARLFPEQAPQTVAHFAALAEGRLAWVDPFTGNTRQDPYYDGVPVHRALAGQRLEAGDRTGTGRGAPPLYVPLEARGPVSFDGAYRLGMTRASMGRISAVQFFVTASPHAWLNGKHPCFGEVVSGQDVVWSICSVRTYSNGKPIDPVVIRRVRIARVGSPPPLPGPLPYVPDPVPFAPREEPARPFGPS